MDMDITKPKKTKQEVRNHERRDLLYLLESSGWMTPHPAEMGVAVVHVPGLAMVVRGVREGSQDLVQRLRRRKGGEVEARAVKSWRSAPKGMRLSGSGSGSGRKAGEEEMMDAWSFVAGECEGRGWLRRERLMGAKGQVVTDRWRLVEGHEGG